MKVIVRAKAKDDIDNVFAWIAKDNPAAAIKMVVHVRERVNLLETDGLAYMGHRGTVAGTFELVVYPYIIVYKVREKRKEILIVSIVHGARNR